MSFTKDSFWLRTHLLPTFALDICRVVYVHIIFVLPLTFSLPLPLPLPLELSLSLSLSGGSDFCTQTVVDWAVGVTSLLLLVDDLLERRLVLLVIRLLLLLRLHGLRAERSELLIQSGKHCGSGVGPIGKVA